MFRRWEIPHSEAATFFHSAVSEPATRWDFSHSIFIARCRNKQRDKISPTRFSIARCRTHNEMGFFPLGFHSAVSKPASAYVLPSSKPTGKRTHTYTHILRGFPPLEIWLRCGMSLTRRITLLLGLLPRWRYQIVALYRGPYSEDASNLSMSFYPHFKSLSCRY